MQAGPVHGQNEFEGQLGVWLRYMQKCDAHPSESPKACVHKTINILQNSSKAMCQVTVFVMFNYKPRLFETIEDSDATMNFLSLAQTSFYSEIT